MTPDKVQPVTTFWHTPETVTRVAVGAVKVEEEVEQSPLVHMENVPAQAELMVAQFQAVGVILHVYVPLVVKFTKPGVQTPPIPGRGTQR